MLYVEDNNRIKIVAGDTGTMRIVIPGYKLVRGDKLYLSVTNATMEDIFPIGGNAIEKTITSFESDGSGIIRIEPRDTKSMTGRHFYDIQVTRSTGEVHTIVPKNIFEVLEEVTTNV